VAIAYGSNIRNYIVLPSYFVYCSSIILIIFFLSTLRFSFGSIWQLGLHLVDLYRFLYLYIYKLIHKVPLSRNFRGAVSSQRWPKPSPVLQRNVNNYLLRYRNTLTYLLTYSLHLPTEGRPGWVAWINTGMVDRPKVVTNRSTNRARGSLTSLMWRTPLPYTPKQPELENNIVCVVLTAKNTAQRQIVDLPGEWRKFCFDCNVRCQQFARKRGVTACGFSAQQNSVRLRSAVAQCIVTATQLSPASAAGKARLLLCSGQF